jgi:hypothetical protein
MKTDIKKPEGYKSSEEEYPELNIIATKIFETSVNKINAIQVNQIETTCPYIRQCVLEMVIEKMQAVV